MVVIVIVIIVIVIVVVVIVIIIKMHDPPVALLADSGQAVSFQDVWGPPKRGGGSKPMRYRVPKFS